MKVPEHITLAIAEQLAASETERTGEHCGNKFYYMDMLLDSVGRALEAGAEPPLDYKGSGATGNVICDRRGHAFKVSRHSKTDNFVADEAEWLETAQRVPGAKEHVATFYKYHPELHVLERECVAGGEVPADYPLQQLHDNIAAAMKPNEWSPPEFNYNAYVNTAGRGPVLVDAGFAARYGTRFVEYVEDLFAGRRPWRKFETPDELVCRLFTYNAKPYTQRVLDLVRRLERLATAGVSGREGVFKES